MVSIMKSVLSIENNYGKWEKELNCFDNHTVSFKESIATIIKNNGFIKCTIKVKGIDSNNGNYLAQLYEVDIKGETGKGKKEINLFIKECVILEKIKVVNINDVYDKEVFTYKNYAKIANELQIEAKIPEHDRFKFVPAHECNNEIIILDNLSKQGFKTYYRMDVMPLKFAELSVMELAKFHALSFVIEIKMPEYFEKHIKTIKTSFSYDEDWSNYVTNVCVNTAKILDTKKEIIANYAPIMREKIKKYQTASGKFTNCLSHGDYRMNNILVKEIDAVPSEVAVVDYQFVDYGNPVRDFLYLIYTSSDRKFRQEHIEDLKNIYYDTLTRFLVYFNLDVNNIYPREEFEKAYTECLEFGLVTGLFLSSFIFIADNVRLDTSQISLSDMGCINMDIRYKERVQGMVDEFAEFGYL